MLIAAYAQLYARAGIPESDKENSEAQQKHSPRAKSMSGTDSNVIEADEALVLRVAAGDREAYSLLVGRYLSKVVSISRRMLGDDAEAEDVAQECFLRLWDRADSFNPGKASFATWLYRVTSNLCIDRLRQLKKQGIKEPLETAVDLGVPASQDRHFTAKQLETRVDQALQGLPERQRQALTLCHFQGMRMKDASEVMEVSVEALESLLARARRSLKKELASEWMQFLPDKLEH